MAIIFSILMSLGLISNPYQSDVKHHNQTKFDTTYSDNSRGSIEWDESH